MKMLTLYFRVTALFCLHFLVNVNFDVCEAYKPVVIIHGVITGNVSMHTISSRIEAAGPVSVVRSNVSEPWTYCRADISVTTFVYHPGTELHITNRYAGWASLAPMWHQVNEIGKDIMKISAAHPEGIHLIGYSQGGLIARVILEAFPNHNVHTFISLSSPQAGQYGTKFLHLFFPNLVCKTAYELFYSTVGQHTSVGNYWNDPHHQELYFSYSRFLPYVNNELKSSNSSMYKASITKLKRMVLIGGPDDGVITPWQSSHFGYFDENEKVVDFKNRSAYLDDTFGLKTLDENQKLKIITVSGVNHLAWHRNTSVIDKYIVPYLD